MFRNLGIMSQFDPDAWSFIDVVGLTVGSQTKAIDQLVRELKGHRLWDKIYALWPMVGGTATTHKWNLKDPQDTDAAFRIVWNGGWTHSSTGALPNGTTGYAATKLIPNNVLNTTDKMSFGYYSRTSTGDSDEYVMGVSESGNKALALIVRRTTDLGYAFMDISGGTYAWASGTVTDGQGFFQATQNVTTINQYRNTTNFTSTRTAGSDTFSTYEMYLGAINNTGTAGQYTNKQCAAAYVAEYLTATEINNFEAAMDNYQTALSRNV